MELITNGRFKEKDVRAIELGTAPVKVLEERLLQEIQSFQGSITAFEEDHLKALAWLLREEKLQIKISVLLDEEGLPLPGANPVGEQHTKIGIIDRSDGEKIAFVGGINESFRGYLGNAESISAFYSWNAEDEGRIDECERIFEAIWTGTSPRTAVFDFPEAARQDLISVYCPAEIPQVAHQTEEIHTQSSPGAVAPDSTQGANESSHKWRHQDEAIEAFLDRGSGILEMATGTGKTRTALRITKQLTRDNDLRGAVIATVGNDLLNQWYSGLLDYFGPSEIFVYREFGSYKEANRFLYHDHEEIPLLVTSFDNLSKVVENDTRGLLSSCLLICDEVHNIGSDQRVSALKGKLDRFPWRLGLSATPERPYDEDGNTFIEEEIGEVIYEFGLEDAIRRGILCEFDYEPLLYSLSDEDRDRIKAAYAAYNKDKEAGDPVQAEKDLRLRLSRVRKESKEKLPVFKNFLRENPEILDNCIMFTETKEYGHNVQKIVYEYRKNYHTYYGEDDEINLRRFANGDISSLVTCKAISEGIDIKSVENIVLFSSDRSKLQTIQRIGRSLRTDPSHPSKRATVVDFILREDLDDSDTGDEPIDRTPPDKERYEWLSELSEVKRDE